MSVLKKTSILNFTILYRMGNPVKTSAVIVSPDESSLTRTGKVKYFEYIKEKKCITFLYKLAKNDRVYGLGESIGGINRRGKQYRLYNTDNPFHTPEKESLYGSHPFIIVDGKNSFALLIDYPSEIVFDIGFNKMDELKITIMSKDFDMYIFDNSNKRKIIKEYLLLTGSPYIPPMWAFGYHQSKWSYPDARTVKGIADKFRKKYIPCDAIYLDLDYMKHLKVFTVDNKRFPDFKKFVNDMKNKGFKLVPIIDPGVKIEDGYDVYEEGKKNDYFCIGKNRNNFEAAVWPGMTHLPDFLRPEVQKWWGGLHKMFFDCGIEGFWNDMNEPSIFYTKEKKNEILNIIKAIKGTEDYDVLSFKEKIGSLSNKREYFKLFYQRDEEGRLVCHDDVHNLFGFNMACSTVEGFKSFLPGIRYFLLSRSSYTGLHRFAAIWMGDNMSWWEHLLLHIKMLVSLNMSGFFFTGADIGGFGGNTSAELLIRWTQLGVFSPLCRNHSALGTRSQEPWEFDKTTLKIIKNAIELRYAFLPYTYSEFMRSVLELTPFVSHLMLHFDTDVVKDIEDQFMYGDSVMIAPVYEANSKGRFVHLPEVKWLYWCVSAYNVREMRVLNPGDYYLKVALDSIPVFLKENSLIVLSKPVNYVGEKSIDEILVVGFVTEKAEFNCFVDDDTNFNYQKGIISTLNIAIERKNKTYKICIDKKEHEKVAIIINTIRFEIYDEDGKLCKKEMKVFKNK